MSLCTSSLYRSADLPTSCKDLVSQNTLLHNHLESVSTQAAKIRDTANKSSTTTEGEGEASDSNLAELRSVVGWLRKEKEIVELQLELSKQEAARFKAQADHLSQSLRQAQTSLSEVRCFSSWVPSALTPRTGEGTRR